MSDHQMFSLNGLHQTLKQRLFAWRMGAWEALLGDMGHEKVLQKGVEASDEGNIRGDMGVEALNECNIEGVRMVMHL
jgi:hypothetical protein